MPRTRSTIDRTTLVTVANRMIAHLAESGTKSDADKRAAIIAATSAVLLEANAYKGFSYLNPPLERPDGRVFDETRVAFY